MGGVLVLSVIWTRSHSIVFHSTTYVITSWEDYFSNILRMWSLHANITIDTMKKISRWITSTVRPSRECKFLHSREHHAWYHEKYFTINHVHCQTFPWMGVSRITQSIHIYFTTWPIPDCYIVSFLWTVYREQLINYCMPS